MKSRSRSALRRAADQVAALDGQSVGPPPPVPELLVRAVEIVEAHPDGGPWLCGGHTVVGEFNLCRLFVLRPAPARNVDIIVLCDPVLATTPAFPVATRVGDRYVAMTDVRGFAVWLALYGGDR